VKRRDMTEEKESERKKRRQSSLLVVAQEVDRRKTLASGTSLITTPIHEVRFGSHYEADSYFFSTCL
jgi:hypothetical protein